MLTNAPDSEPLDWDGQTYYVAFGDGEHRDWDDAREFGFVAAGGDPWYSKSLRRLGPGNGVLVYVPKASGWADMSAWAT